MLKKYALYHQPTTITTRTPTNKIQNRDVKVSAFEDGEEIIPVKFEVKEFLDKQNILYVAITLNGIKKTEVLGQGNTKNGVTQYSRSVNISILDFMRLVNPSDTNFTKYFPEGIITEEQKEQLRFSRKETDDFLSTNFSVADLEFFYDNTANTILPKPTKTKKFKRLAFI